MEQLIDLAPKGSKAQEGTGRMKKKFELMR